MCRRIFTTTLAATIAALSSAVVVSGVLLLPKPYRKVDLARMIRPALEADPPARIAEKAQLADEIGDQIDSLSSNP
jgi:hypothetical protein